MPVEALKITDESISDAESVLLGEDQHFDPDARDFIRDLGCADLQAVPGSGKTTALMAKLFLLARHLPFGDGSGILIVSHTNAAANQIINRLMPHCPSLFTYPNYAGTLQSFVDTFLAIPRFAMKYARRPSSIDDDHYLDIFFSILSKKTAYSLRQSHPEDIKEFALSLALDSTGKLTRRVTTSKLGFRDNTQTYQDLLKTLQRLRELGTLRYDDAYDLADDYLREHPIVAQLLRKRFRFIFVDEMQDMAKHQVATLSALFDAPDGMPVVQRIGDANQAIYHHHRLSAKAEWRPRQPVLPLRGSYRLSNAVANAAMPFGLVQSDIRPLGSNPEIKPQIIVYDDTSIIKVIPYFAELVESYRRSGSIPAKLAYPVKAVAWVRSQPKEGQIRLGDYFPDFESDAAAPKRTHARFIDYLYFPESPGRLSLRHIRSSIVRALLKVLRFEEVVDHRDRHYSETTFCYKLRSDPDTQYYEDFKLKLLSWTLLIYRSGHQEAFKQIRDFLPDFLGHIGVDFTSKRTDQFLAEPPSEAEGEVRVKHAMQGNYVMYGDTRVEIGTVHSVKGETHTATLYLETFYHGKYESQYLADCFLGGPHGFSLDDHTDVWKKEAIKMAYVGFTRPTHLLCYAVHKDRLPLIKDTTLWNVVTELVER